MALLWAQVGLGKVAGPPGRLREGSSNSACPQHLPGRFLQPTRGLQPTRPHPVGCRFRPDPASSFGSQTWPPALASLTLTSHGTHPRSSVNSRPGPGHARHTCSPTHVTRPSTHTARVGWPGPFSERPAWTRWRGGSSPSPGSGPETGRSHPPGPAGSTGSPP